jgi:hypothetical protein
MEHFTVMVAHAMTTTPDARYLSVAVVSVLLYAASEAGVTVVTAGGVSSIQLPLEDESRLSRLGRVRRRLRSLSRWQKIYAALAATCIIGAAVAIGTGFGVPVAGIALGILALVPSPFEQNQPPPGFILLHQARPVPR